MKAPRGMENLADRLRVAASTPLAHSSEPVVRAPSVVAEAPEQTPSPKAKKTQKVPVFLRLDADLFARYDAKAIARTKKTGRGVSVQQVIVELLEEGA